MKKFEGGKKQSLVNILEIEEKNQGFQNKTNTELCLMWSQLTCARQNLLRKGFISGSYIARVTKYVIIREEIVVRGS